MLINGREISIGADPELFVKSGGSIVSGYGLIPGDKADPHKVELGAVQVDGMALEFNIDPAKNVESFYNNVLSVMSTLRKMIPEGHELEVVPTAHFDKDYIEAQPEAAKVLGCDPDMNAYTGGFNDSPDGRVTFRTAGGHIHIGWGEDVWKSNTHFEECQQIIKHMDYFVGLPSLLFDDDVDRRSLYGKAGAFRVKDYGVEYRTLSNKWISSPELIKFVFNQTILAVRSCFAGKDFIIDDSTLQDTINNSDKDMAKKICELEGWELPDVH